MDIFNVLTLLGGLCLFLFGMNIMGQALERRAGNSLRTLLGKLTTSKLAGFLTGCGVTAVIQSSSATTVMVVGFVNSGLMTLRQGIHVILGANVGTTVTSWILSLAGIDSNVVWIKLLKPDSFTPVLAVIGIIFYMFCKSSKKKDTGMILLGFATLMFGMETMSSAVSGISEVPAFRQLFLMFENPILGLLAGAVLTAIIQSSSASVGILQALAATGQVTCGAAIPIIMGQNIGTCITAILSSAGANKNARRAAFVHMLFNITGSLVLLAVFSIVKAIFDPVLFHSAATEFNIAIFHTTFNILCVLILMPASGLLEKVAMKVIRDTEAPEQKVELDERLLATPPLALQQCRDVAVDMARCSIRALENGLLSLSCYTPELAERIRADEDRSDHYEDILGTYLVRLSALKLSTEDSEEAAKLLKVIGDFERISDHGVNLLASAEEMREKTLSLTEAAVRELDVLSGAVREIMSLSLRAFVENDLAAAASVEPLEQVIDDLKEQLRSNHILRMQQGNCSMEMGFVWSDLLTSLSRTSDHCSNIAGCVIETAQHNLNLHETLRATKSGDAAFEEMRAAFEKKYALS